MTTPLEDIFGIKNCPVLEDLTREELEELRGRTRVRDYDAVNGVVCEENTTGDGFGILASGQVRVFKLDDKGKEHLLAVLKEGDFFGEMALLDLELRSASVHALEPTRVLWIFRQDFEELRQSGSPLVGKLLFRMMTNLSQRLRLLNERYVYVRSCYTTGGRGVSRYSERAPSYATLSEDS